MKNQRINTRTLTGVAIFTAIVVVLQLLGSFIRFGQFSISLVLIPIVVGAALYGVGAGAWLGFVFGIAVLLTDSALFFSVNPIGTVITVLAKGALAGWCAGLVFKALEKKNTWLAVIAAAIVCPVVNTGVFVIGCNLFFLDFIKELAANAGFESAGALILFGFVGLNFVFEMLVNIVLSPVILRLIKIGKKG